LRAVIDCRFIYSSASVHRADRGDLEREFAGPMNSFGAGERMLDSMPEVVTDQRDVGT
jgi:hypothetical protein